MLLLAPINFINDLLRDVFNANTLNHVVWPFIQIGLVVTVVAGWVAYASYLELDRTSDDFEIKLYWNRLESPFRIVLFNLPQRSTNDTYALDLTRRLKVGVRHNLTFGVSLRLDHFNITIAPDGRDRLVSVAKLAGTPFRIVVIGPEKCF